MSDTHRLCDLNEDVLSRIFEQVAAIRDTTYKFSVALKSLSVTSRRMRLYSMPILFHDCRVLAGRASGAPPEAIRSHVRHLHYFHPFYSIDELIACGELKVKPLVTLSFKRDTAARPPPFGVELDYLPALRAVTFSIAPGGVPWSAIMRCMAHPTITSISLGEDAMWRSCAPPANPSDLAVLTCRLNHFSYTPPQWREAEHNAHRVDLGPTYAQESSYLHALVLPMSATAESLALPVETAPLTEMAELDWPRLHTLTLIGRYTHPDQCHAISLLLRRAPNLRSLSVKVKQQESIRRPLLLKTPPETGYRLRSLTVAYPNPDDPLFSCIGDGLRSLSLRDSPRHYFKERYSDRVLQATFPILTASECLSILQRISAPRLSILELVYEADEVEDQLLGYLPHAFPLLQELELHRYKAHPEDDLPYLHIAEALKAIKYLRALYFNVDITTNACNAWKPGYDRRVRQRDRRFKRGLALARLFETSEYFEYIALPLHGLAAGIWELFSSSWMPVRFIERAPTYTVDSPAFRIRWHYA